LIKIQDQIYNYILPTINAAIDDKAELQLALEAYGNKGFKKQQAFLSLLEDSMGQLIRHEAMNALTLIDLLTLMGDKRKEELDPFSHEQFYLALEASRCGLSDKDEQSLMQRIIWRRCFLRDNWAEVNNTDLKDDQQVSEQLRRTALYSTFKACFKNRIFEKDSNVKPITPQDVLGAGTEELDHRFKRLDTSIRERIMKDMQVEDNSLKPYIEKCRLDKWHQGTLDLATSDFRDEVAEETADGEQMRQAARKLSELEKGITKDEKSKAESLLQSKPRYKPKPKSKLDSHKGSTFRSSIQLY